MFKFISDLQAHLVTETKRTHAEQSTILLVTKFVRHWDWVNTVHDNATNLLNTNIYRRWFPYILASKRVLDFNPQGPNASSNMQKCGATSGTSPDSEDPPPVAGLIRRGGRSSPPAPPTLMTAQKAGSGEPDRGFAGLSCQRTGEGSAGRTHQMQCPLQTPACRMAKELASPLAQHTEMTRQNPIRTSSASLFVNALPMYLH
ncbi:hypothetical protein B0H13DRAFT_1883073 [Mycena leptocephala]|nr:hypothetical protein B0H13DRAFT_1883073 [Mycena leptocephala]